MFEARCASVARQQQAAAASAGIHTAQERRTPTAPSGPGGEDATPSAEEQQRRRTRSVKSPATPPGSSVVSGSAATVVRGDQAESTGGSLVGGSSDDDDDIATAHGVVDDAAGSSRGKASRSAEEAFVKRGSSSGAGERHRSASPLAMEDASQSPPMKLLGPVLDEPLVFLGIHLREQVLAGASGGSEGAAARRETRRQAARTRFRIPAGPPPPPPPRGRDGGAGGRSASETGTGRCEDGVEEEEEAVVLLPLEVILDQAILRVPHDESPTRIYEFSEIWGEAVEQVGFLTGPVGRRMRLERGSGSQLMPAKLKEMTGSLLESTGRRAVAESCASVRAITSLCLPHPLPASPGTHPDALSPGAPALYRGAAGRSGMPP